MHEGERMSAGKLLLGVVIFFVLLSVPYVVTARDTAVVEIVFFYDIGCPDCVRIATFLDRMEKEHAGLVVHRKNIRTDNIIRILQRLEYLYQVKSTSVPVIFIDEQVFTGAGRVVEFRLEQEIARAFAVVSISPLARLAAADIAKEGIVRTVTIPVVIAAAAVDSINPCAFTVLLLLLGTLTIAGKKKELTHIGIAFTTSIFISYFLIGIGLYSAIYAAAIQRIIFFLSAGLAILIGSWNIKDYLWAGRWPVIRVPLPWQSTLNQITTKIVSVPGAFVSGFLVSLFLLPCSSGPYIVILGLLAETATRNHAISLLALYNLIFVLPLVIITIAVSLGYTTTARAERWRTNWQSQFSLASGAVMLTLGVGMLVVMNFGFL
jgi:cytochrome c biogenesis protein CcdA/glutaredoxin